jgi:eukaryotic-like serine/threonine-protein kinase
MIGRRLLHYQITKRLGTGGQATAYLAKDTKLARAVVLKLLDAIPAANDASRKRFLREARLAATLDHPSICTIHDIHEADGHHFIVMQHVDGETLKALLARRRLPLETVLGIALQVADGLAAAHRAGVVHRDVKTANVMISHVGRAVILDFGLAKALPSGQSAELDVTDTIGGGTPFGTPTYMSPEQVRGDIDVGPPSDVFSFGVILYEMLAGAKPFHKKTGVETMTAILNTEPLPLRQLVPDLAPELERVVARCLDKEQAARYPSAVALLADLSAAASSMGFGDLAAAQSMLVRSRRRLSLGRQFMASTIDLFRSATALIERLVPRKALPASAAAASASTSTSITHDTSVSSQSTTRTPSKLSIAILPLKNIGADAQYEHFGSGLADTLISELAVVGDLFVRPLRTVLKYAEGEVDPLAIGQEIGVDVLLDGSFQVAGDTLRATLRLFDVRDGNDIWSERFDQPLADLFALQDRVARRVVEGLRIHLTDYEKEKLRAAPSGDVTAYDHYSRARYLFERSHARRDFEDAAALFKRAIEADPGFVPAHSGLGKLYLMLWFIYRSEEGWLDEAEAACREAIRINPDFAESYSALASICLERGHKDDAYLNLQRAFALAPNDLESYLALGWLYRWSGLLDRAVRCYKTAIKIDPGYWRTYWGLAMTYVCLGQLDEAERRVAHFLTRVDPQHPVMRYVQGDVWFYRGEYEQARQIGELMKAAAPEQPFGAVLLSKVYAAQGDAERAGEEMARVTRLVGTRGDASYWKAQVDAMRGASDEALAELQTSVAMGNENFPWFERDHTLDALRVDPRFVALMDELRTRWLEYEQRYAL